MKKNYEIPESVEIKLQVENNIMSEVGGDVPPSSGEEF